jgi:hypothetical protein
LIEERLANRAAERRFASAVSFRRCGPA